MPIIDINGLAQSPQETLSFSGSDITSTIQMPLTRADIDGDRPLSIVGVGLFLGGNGATRSVRLRVGGAYSAYFNVTAHGPTYTGLKSIVGGVGDTAATTTLTLGYDTNGLTYFGHSAKSGINITDGSATWSGRSLVGLFSYIQVSTAPGTPTATPGATSVALAWNAPSDDGDGTISLYTIEWSTSSSFTSPWTTTSTTRSKTISGLDAGQTYYFRVFATNEAGRSARSGSVSATTGSAPSAPTNLYVSPEAGAATATWVAPDNDGGLPVIDYTLDYSTSSSFSGATSVVVTGTSKYLSGLTAGLTYYFRVKARNSKGFSPYTPTESALLGDVPGAPPSLDAVAGAGLLSASWGTPSSGGVAIIDYRLEVSTASDFAGATVVTTTSRSATITGLAPGTLYYARVRARNSVGSGAWSTTDSATTTTRGALDIVKAAAVTVGATHVSIRSDGAASPTLTLGYVVFGTGTAFVPIATLPADFARIGGDRHLALVADAAGNLYVIGGSATAESTVVVRRYAKTGPTSWTLSGALSQALPSTGNALVQFAAAYVPGSPATILMLARRAGTVGAGALSYATLNLANIAASSGALFTTYGSDPSWLATPPTAAAANSGVLDITPLVPGGTRLAILANGTAVVDVLNGAVSSVSKSPSGTSVTGAWARVLGVNSVTFVVLTIASGALSWVFYGTNGVALGSGSYAGANSQGGAFGAQWDAYVDRVAGLVTVYYVADDDPRKLESIDISPSTYAATAAVVRTSTLGATSSTNTALRIAEGFLDERRVLIESANLLAGAKSTAAYSDTSGNVAPDAPALVDVVGFEAAQSVTFQWSYSDPNPLDTQSSRAISVERASDSVVVYSDTTATATLSQTVAGGTFANGIDYRWRVQTSDALGATSPWSAYDTFTVSALGTLTITDPAADDPAGLDVSSVPITWTYTQPNGYVQTQRRVRLLETATGNVVSDTGMQASTATTYVVTDIPTDVQVTIELSIVTNAPGTPTVTTTRRLTTSYGSPMTPTIEVSVGESFVNITVTNPPPEGSRPEVVHNLIERRAAGTDDDFLAIAVVAPNGVYSDHAVRSATSYDYRARGVS